MSFFNRSRFFSCLVGFRPPNHFHPSIAASFVFAFVCAAALLLNLPRASYSADDAIGTVTNNNDSGPGSLRAIIVGAASGDTIMFDPSVVGTIVLTSGELTITTNLTIFGPGRETLAVSGNNASRVFSITAASNVTISGLTIRNGNSNSYGGGIYSAGSLTMINSAIVSNTAPLGGGIFIESATGNLTLNSSTVASNTASAGFGGGVALGPGAAAASNSGTMLITNSTITGSKAAGRGGGISSSGPVTLISSVVSSNIGENGGGINASTLTINNSTISGNTAHVDDSSMAPEANGAQGEMQIDSALAPLGISATGDGGGVYSIGGVVTVTNSTIAGNMAGNSGGGFAISGTMSITNSTISGNRADLVAGAIASKGGTLTISYSTLARNSSLFPPAGIAVAGPAVLKSAILDNEGKSNCAAGATGVITSLGFNLDSGNTCGLNASGDLSNTNPLLGPLANNGGPTLTHALFFGSPAINAGDNIGCPATDQRGVARPQAARCDIGAYEAFPPRLFMPLIDR